MCINSRYSEVHVGYAGSIFLVLCGTKVQYMPLKSHVNHVLHLQVHECSVLHPLQRLQSCHDIDCSTPPRKHQAAAGQT